MFVSVVGGLSVNEPAADLGVTAAVTSAFRNRPLQPGTIVFGEVGLGGGSALDRPGGAADSRSGPDGVLSLRAPRAHAPEASDEIELVPIDTLDQALDQALG